MLFRSINIEEAQLDKKKPKIYIRCPNWVGDIVMATPVFKCVRENYPEAIIVGGIRKYAAGVIEDCPHFDSVMIFDDRTPSGFLRLIARIKSEHFDKAILLTNSARAFFPTFFGRVREIFGYRRNVQKFFLSGGPRPLLENGRIKPIPMTEYYMSICREMGMKIPDIIKTELFTTEKSEKDISAILIKHGIGTKDKILCINPGAKFGSSKCWGTANFAKFAELANKEIKARLILISGPGEEELAREIISKSAAPIIHLGNINLSMLKPLIKRSSLLLTNDTGPRHYATAFGVPSLVIIGPTNKAYTAYGLDITKILRVELDCSPCHLKTCPIDHKCMTLINPEMVISEAKKILRQE
jgi:heptosyltransferase-2